jgi:hypothetical protein
MPFKVAVPKSYVRRAVFDWHLIHYIRTHPNMAKHIGTRPGKTDQVRPNICSGVAASATPHVPFWSGTRGTLDKRPEKPAGQPATARPHGLQHGIFAMAYSTVALRRQSPVAVNRR